MHAQRAIGTTHVLCGIVMGIAFGMSSVAAEKVATPPGVSESAPARTGKQTVPTAGEKAGKATKAPKAPASVSESAPARTGPASTPTGGKGQATAPTTTEPLPRQPKTPASVSESAPARTGAATTPTAEPAKGR